MLDRRANGAPLRLPHPDWLHHRLTIAGPGDVLEKFRVAAAGAGVVPWQLDIDRTEEDLFHVLAGAGTLSLEGARVLSGQLGEAVTRRHAQAVARVGRSLACPFDLHALVHGAGSRSLPWAGSSGCAGLDVGALGHDGGAAACHCGRRYGSTNEGTDGNPFLVGGLDALAGPEKIRAEWPALRFDIRPEYGTR